MEDVKFTVVHNVNWSPIDAQEGRDKEINKMIRRH